MTPNQAQVSRLEYLVQQRVNAGLVASAREWAGIHSATICESETLDGTWCDRTCGAPICTSAISLPAIGRRIDGHGTCGTLYLRSTDTPGGDNPH